MVSHSRASHRVEHALASLDGVGGERGVLTDPASIVAYQSDALQHRRGLAAAVVLPSTPDEVRRIVSACHDTGVPFVARGHGTGLSGGATPVAGGVVIGLGRLDRILELDPANRIAVVEPGVTTAGVSRAAAPYDLYFAPDPSSAEVCSIGGNIAENAGGAHCLKYGTTINHALGLEVILPDGSMVHLGGGAPGLPGSELIPLFVGSEGTLGIVTQATLRLSRTPESVTLLLATFHSLVAAGEAVSRVIAAGIVPAAMEAMDRLAIAAGEPIAHAGLALVEAALLIELDGPSAEVAAHTEITAAICRAAGAFELRIANSATERASLWKARKAAVAGMGRVSPAYLLQDAVVPRSRLSDVLAEIAEIAARHRLRIANVFHAGDGNLHPVICYDPAVAGDLDRAGEAAAEIVAVCLRLGGSLTGEHGVGLDKLQSLPKMLGPDELETHGWIRSALDPATLANPGKAVPPAVRHSGSESGARRRIEEWADALGHDPDVGLRVGVDADAVAGLRPAFVAEPRSADAVGRIVTGAGAGEVSVVVRGGATKLGAAVRLTRCDVMLDTRRLTGLIDYRPDDFVATIAAGTTIEAADTQLAGSGQWLGIDPPWAGRATIGGVFATNAAGSRRLRSGAPRDRILAAHFVRPDGKLVTAGAAVIKNVAGYDLARLLAGTHGVLGILTDVSVRLAPLPPASLTVALGFPGVDQLAQFLAQLGASALEPSCVDLAPATRLLIRFETVKEACTSQAEQLSQLAAACAASVEVLTGTAETSTWQEQERTIWQHPGTLAVAAGRPTVLLDLLRELRAAVLPANTQLIAAGPIIAGELYIALDGEPDSVIAVLARARRLLEPRRAALTVRRLPSELVGRIAPWPDANAAAQLMRTLKHKFDPAGILNPGLFWN